MSVAQPSLPLLVIHFTGEASVEGVDICGGGKHLQQSQLLKIVEGKE